MSELPTLKEWHDYRRSVAIHEAGHAVAAVCVGRGLRRVTIDPKAVQRLGAGDDTAGYCVLTTLAFLGENGTGRDDSGHVRSASPASLFRWAREIEREMTITAAGPVAQSLHEGVPLSAIDWQRDEYAGDYETIEVQAKVPTPRSDGTPHGGPAGAIAAAAELLTRPAVWAAVMQVALALLARPVVSGRRVRAIVRAAGA